MGYVKGRTTRKAKSDTTWLATQVGPRTVKAGLGGHEAGVFGVDEGVENTSIPLRKRGRMAMFVCVTISDLWVLRTIMSARKEMIRGWSVENRAFLITPDAIWILSATQDEIGR